MYLLLFPFLLPLSSAQLPQTGRTFHFQLNGNFTYVTISLLNIMVRNNNTLSQASKVHSGHTDGSFLEFGKHFSLSAKHGFKTLSLFT